MQTQNEKSEVPEDAIVMPDAFRKMLDKEIMMRGKTIARLRAIIEKRNSTAAEYRVTRAHMQYQIWCLKCDRWAAMFGGILVGCATAFIVWMLMRF
jgi:hypothetical protein